MCGIAGLLTTEPGKIDRGLVEKMLSTFGHRGPDDYGFAAIIADGSVVTGREWTLPSGGAHSVLLHRRLSILDVSASGWQPMSTPDGRYHIVFNGEIYNFVELRQELESLGYSFRSRSDTEVLLQAYVQWGEAALRRLTGMFAFVVLDAVRQKLFLARDSFGIKPLYYVSGDGFFAFASEIRTLLEIPQVPRNVDPNRLYRYLRYGMTDSGDGTLFRAVRQVPPAHFMEIDLRQLEPQAPVQYWAPDLERRCELSFDDAARRLQEIFLRNIELHLRSDVPVGAALSGGIDSSAIVGGMRHVGGPGLELHTFSYIADDPQISEERWVDVVTAATGATVHKIHAQANTLVTDLQRLIEAQGEPFGSTSIYAQHSVFRAASQAGIKVMLDGQGADELLGGYRFYQAARFASLVRQGRWLQAHSFSGAVAGHPGVAGRLSVAVRAGDYLVPPALQHFARRLVGKDLVPSWLRADWFDDRGVAMEAPNYTASPEVLRSLLLRTLTETSLPHLLRYEDRNSMAFSIESRVPFLTTELAQFVLTLPEEYLIAPDGTSKAVFRAAMRGIVPDAILDRRDKIGFATPEYRWLTALSPWVDEVLSTDLADSVPFLNIAEVRRQWAQVRTQQASFDNRIWRWLNLLEWVRQFSVTFV